MIALGAGIGIYIGASRVQETPATTSSQPAAPVTLNLGESVTVTQDGSDVGTLTISSVEVTALPPDWYSKPPVNGYYVIADVKFRVRDDFTGSYYINPYDFYAVVNGVQYEFGNDNATYMDWTFKEGYLEAGQSASGTVSFDVPAMHGEIAYSPIYGGPIAFWRFPPSAAGV